MLMVKNFLKSIPQALLGTFLLFLIMESVCYLLGIPQGATRFTEITIIREKLHLKKPNGEYRIFTYGESTMFGAHYGSVSSPARWLEVYLKDFLPGKNIRVVNFGRIGQSSADCYETFKGSLAYKPDLAIFYVGHNSFLPGTRENIAEAKRKDFVHILRHFFRKSRFVSAVYRSVLKLSLLAKNNKSKSEIYRHAIEVFPPGIKTEYVVPRNTSFYSEAIEFFKANVLKISDLAEKNHVPVLFLKPVSNLKDFAPQYSVHMKKLAPDELNKWDTLYEKGKKAQAENKLTDAFNFYNQAYAIDDTFADLSFRLGQIYFRTGEFKKARSFFEEARDNDAVVSRATKETLEFLEELSKAEKIQLIDTKKVLAPEVVSGILGEPIIEDNVHLSLKGHSLVGRLMAQEIAERNWIASKEEWKFERERPYEEIEKQLGIDNHIKVYTYLQIAAYLGSQYENRIRVAQKALKLEPNNSQVLRALAWAYWLKGDKDKAVEIYKKLEQLDPQAFGEVIKVQPRIKDFTAKIEFFKARKRAVTEPLPLI